MAARRNASARTAVPGSVPSEVWARQHPRDRLLDLHDHALDPHASDRGHDHVARILGHDLKAVSSQPDGPLGRCQRLIADKTQDGPRGHAVARGGDEAVTPAQPAAARVPPAKQLTRPCNYDIDGLTHDLSSAHNGPLNTCRTRPQGLP